MQALGGNSVRIHAPITGVLRSLGCAPDPAFSERMLGDGVAIDPLGSCVFAPFDGIVVMIAKTGHSVTIRSDCGIELLIHVGIDTVSLNGEGFDPQAVEGQSVKRGDPLLLFDLDLIAQRARDCLTPVIIVAGSRSMTQLRSEGPVVAGEPILDVAVADVPHRALASSEPSTAHLCIAVRLVHGIHARPAGQIARFARNYDGSITVSKGEHRAAAASTTELMKLGVSHGEEISIRVVGSEARKTALALGDLLEQLTAAEQGSGDVLQEVQVAANIALEHPDVRQGVKAAPGVAIGPIRFLRSFDREVPVEAGDPEEEKALLDAAIRLVGAVLNDEIATADGVAAEILGAHQEVLADPALQQQAKRHIEAGLSAASSWRKASRAQEEFMLSMPSSRMRERAIDFRDVERRIIDALLGEMSSREHVDYSGCIVVCDDVEPSLLMTRQGQQIAAICCAGGGATSHAAILAASLGIPMVVGLGSDILSIAVNTTAVVDADRGLFDFAPSDETIQDAKSRASLAAAQAEEALASSWRECRTKDGFRVEVFANLASQSDARIAITQGAEGCGLLRTEFLFSERASEPSEHEQIEELRAIAAELDGRPFIVRTLDVGGDKPIAYFPFKAEANPALGMRGIRFGLKHRDVLRRQLKAMLQAVPASQLRIMLPMVIEADEIFAAREMIADLTRELELDADVPLGIMVETPAAVLMSASLAEVSDFFSIGSNDLAQYVLAMDRGNSELAARADALHPAVLRAIRTTVEGAKARDRWVGICGGIASDVDAAPLLVGLGCVELSSVPKAVPAIKKRLRHWSRTDCDALAEEALAQSSAQDVRRLLKGERA